MRLLVFLLLTVLAAQSAVAQTADPQLLQLRRQLALYYLDPAPHMALAKYFWQKGDRLQAFYNLEYARRDRFPEPQFNQAFQKAFGGRRGPTETKQGEAAFNRAIALQQAGEIKQADEYFVKAAELSPNSVHIQSWVGRFFFKVRHDNLRALPFYLNAYFLDPNAYESEFVESRIRTINYDEAMLRYRQMARNDASVEDILKETNPTVIVLALEALSENWKPAYLKPFVKAMAHDDEGVRWEATLTIAKNVDRSFDADLRALLQDSDLRIRGLAAYIAVPLWKREGFDVVRGMLREEAQLLRFDALSALARDGGREALAIMAAHRRFETHPTLRRLIDDAR